MAAAAAEAETAELEQLVLPPAGGVTALPLARPSRLESEGSRAKRWLSSGEDLVRIRVRVRARARARARVRVRTWLGLGLGLGSGSGL